MVHYLGFYERYFLRLGMHFHKGCIDYKEHMLFIKKIYDKNYRPVSVSTACILLWSLGPDPFLFGNEQ